MEKMNAAYWGFVVGMIVASTISILVFTKQDMRFPQAINVYRGETTLKYTVIDSVITDSCVVWKK